MSRSTVHGVVFALFVCRPLSPSSNEPRAIPIPRCSEIVAVIRVERKSVSILIEHNCSAAGALLSAGRCANLFASAAQADSKLRLSTSHNKITCSPDGCLRGVTR